jgi:hypothetical protein
MDPMLSKRSFERHVTNAIKQCQIEEKRRKRNENEIESANASANAEERNLLSQFQTSGIYNFDVSDGNTVGEQENFDEVDFFIGEERMCVSQLSEYNTSSDENVDVSEENGNEEYENIPSDGVVVHL